MSRWCVVGLLAAATGACANPLAGGGRATRSAAAPVAAAPTFSDPVAAFAASAFPGSETVVALPETGGSARLRLLRSYAAASGRECREVLIGTGLAERTRVVCRDEGGNWTTARPLLRGGGRS